METACLCTLPAALARAQGVFDFLRPQIFFCVVDPSILARLQHSRRETR